MHIRIHIISDSDFTYKWRLLCFYRSPFFFWALFLPHDKAQNEDKWSSMTRHACVCCRLNHAERRLCDFISFAFFLVIDFLRCSFAFFHSYIFTVDWKPQNVAFSGDDETHFGRWQFSWTFELDGTCFLISDKGESEAKNRLKFHLIRRAAARSRDIYSIFHFFFLPRDTGEPPAASRHHWHDTRQIAV